MIIIRVDEKGRAIFDIRTNSDAEIISAIMGLEGYLAAKTGMDAKEIREIIDDEKAHVNVRQVDRIEDIDMEEPTSKPVGEV